MTDEQLLIEVGKTGSDASFTELYRRLFPRLVGFLLSRRCSNAHECEDIAQDTFLRVFLKASTYRGESKAYSWIVRIAINQSVEAHRKSREVMFPDRQTALLLITDHRPDPSEEFAERQERDNINRILETELGRQQAQIIRLLDIDGIDYEDAAKRLGIPVGTVRSRRHRAVARLRQLLAAVVLLAVGVCSVLGGQG
jgi:RNA polymerase sigma-70 factor (ECF subfamily)